MDFNMIQMAVCMALFVLGVVLVVGIWKRASTRASLWWLGLALLPLGALLAGAVPALIDAWNSMALWWQGATATNPMPPSTMAGLVIGGLGLLLMLGSRLVPYKKKDADARRAARAAKKARTSADAGATATSTTYASATPASTKPDYSTSTDSRF